MTKQVNVAIIGASSLVGEALLELLQERHFPVAELYLLDSEDEAGGRVEFNHHYQVIRDVAGFDFSKANLALFVGETALSENYVPSALEAGCFVVDRSPVFRHHTNAALVVAGVNNELITNTKLVASPSCISIQLARVLMPIQQTAGIESLVVSTYQAVSGAGRAGLEEVGHQTAALLNFREVKSQVFPRQMAFNVIPQIGEFDESGYTEEELKVINETRKLLSNELLPIDVTTVRVPVFYGHSLSVSVKTHQPVDLNKLQQQLQQITGLHSTEPVDAQNYPTPVSDASGQADSYLGRLRTHRDNPQGLSFWLTADNIRACASLNVLAIAEQYYCA